MEDLRDAANDCGLQLHPDKTKVVTNVTRKRGRGSNTHVKVRDMNMEILALSQSVKYLGQQLTFDNNAVEREIDNRIKAGWSKFHQYKQELTNKRYDLFDRLRLFQATITPTVLYACQTWTIL